MTVNVNDETVLSHSCSIDVAVSRPDAVWLFPAGAVRGAGATVPAHLQDR